MLSEQEKLQRDIHGLTESIRLSWADVPSKPMRPKDRRELRGHIAGLITELPLARFTRIGQMGPAPVFRALRVILEKWIPKTIFAAPRNSSPSVCRQNISDLSLAI
jgi:hypothetical protein